MNTTGLYINLEKMELLQDSILVLGYIINRHKLRQYPDKVNGIKTAKIPENLKELRGFLCSVNYLKKYILNCSQMQEPLTELLIKGAIFIMNNRRVEAFQTLKYEISDQIMLHALRDSKGFIIACDAFKEWDGSCIIVNSKWRRSASRICK